ncbi:MAG: hypothetical protein MZW92_40155 [Comamonadaceae bacterium]|nr:hypothetical protein [Comamonadaceae bacterium]
MFGDYMSRVLPLGAHSSAIYAALIVVALTAVNIAGLQRVVAHAEPADRLLEVLGLLLVVVAGFMAHARPRSRAAAPAAPRRRRLLGDVRHSRWCSCCSPTAAGTRPPTSRPRSRAARARSCRCW